MSSRTTSLYFLVVLAALAYYAHCKYQNRIAADLFSTSSSQPKNQKTENLVTGFQARQIETPPKTLNMLTTKEDSSSVILLGGVDVPQKPILFPINPAKVYPELDFAHRNLYPEPDPMS